MKLQGIKRYEAYKDSGVEWLGEVPAHWLEQRVKDIALLERGKFTHRPRNDPQMYDGEHPFIQTGDVTRANKYVNNYKQTLSDKGTEVSKKFKKGTLLMAIAANIGDVAILGFDSYLPDSVVGYKPKKNDTDYLFYLFTATKNELNRVKITSTQDNLNLERLNSLIKFVPPFLEQQAIAAHLDTQTAQIDRKIELLSQKAVQYGKLKQSLINETVTRGLDKTVPMKDSGVEWVGEVPKHWQVKRLEDVSFVIDPQPDHRAPAHAEGDGYPYIGIRDLNKDGSLNFETARKVELSAVEKQEQAFKVLSGDILFCKVGTLGEPRIIIPKGRFALSATLVLIKVKSKASNNFLKYALDSSCVFDQINHFGSGSTRPALGIKQIRKFFFPSPSLSEQQAIANYLDEKTAHIDGIITTINSQIDKLKELRFTLINDVVTGKNKVA